MICVNGERNVVCCFAVSLYSCIICVPFLQIWQAVIRICKFVVDPHHQPESSYCGGDNPDWELDLPVSRFQELDDELMMSTDEEEEMCSICLVEFEGEDSVNKLPKCGHLFHADCLDKWLDRCQFTCPLCRSSMLQLRSSSPCKSHTPRPPPFCLDLDLDHPSS